MLYNLAIGEHSLSLSLSLVNLKPTCAHHVLYASTRHGFRRFYGTPSACGHHDVLLDSQVFRVIVSNEHAVSTHAC